jgi:hypothetical protein
MIIWGGSSDTGGRYNPASDKWAATTVAGAPTPRSYHTAAWTGANMLISGGADMSSAGHTTYRYVPPRTLYVYLLP